MPPNEDIEAICLGQGWAAAATTSLLLRLFTIGGVQKEVFSLPGPVVSMAGHGEQLVIVYHRGRFFLVFYILLYSSYSIFSTHHCAKTCLNRLLIWINFMTHKSKNTV